MPARATAAGRSRRTRARSKVKSIARSARCRAPRVRALWIGADGCRRPRARAGGAPRAVHESPAGTLRRRINDELPADIHIITLDKAPHRFHARHDAVSRSLSLSDFPAAHRIREAVRLVDARAARSRRDAAGRRRRSSAGRISRRISDDDPEEKSTVVAGRSRGDRRSGRAAARSASRDRIFSGRWCGEWSACSPRSAEAR